MLNNLATDQRTLFFERHDPHITIGSEIWFHDGASTVDGTSGMDPLVEPPTDPWERAKRVELFYAEVANRKLEQFERFRQYLRGTGRREDSWLPHLFTEEDSLRYLETLSITVQRARARANKARWRAAELAPPELEQERADEVAELVRRNDFLAAVDSVKLWGPDGEPEDTDMTPWQHQIKQQAPMLNPPSEHPSKYRPKANGQTKSKRKQTKRR